MLLIDEAGMADDHAMRNRDGRGKRVAGRALRRRSQREARRRAVESDRFDHANAVTVHRMQGAIVDRAHVCADGGGRELAYVAMSRPRPSQVYVTADDLDQAVEDLRLEWSAHPSPALGA